MVKVENIKNLMVKNELTLKDIAEALGVCKKTARNKLNNNSNWYVKDIVILCNLFKVDVREIVE